MPRSGPRLHARKYPDILDHDRHVAFLRARCQARYRGEEWDMTIEDWFDMWPREMWACRGRGYSDLCMIRVDIHEPWSKSNCQIVTRYEQLCRGRKPRRFPGAKQL